MDLIRLEKSRQRDQQIDDLIRKEVERCFPSNGQRPPEQIDTIFVAECKEVVVYKTTFDEFHTGRAKSRDLYVFMSSSEITLFEFEAELLQKLCNEIHKNRLVIILEAVFQPKVVAGFLAILLCLLMGAGLIFGYRGDPPQSLVQLVGIAFAFYFGTQASSSLRDRGTRRDSTGG
jgi:hypothetical protein